LEQRGLVRRTRSKEDRRQVLVSLLPRGEKLLETVVQQRISELRASGRELVKAIEALLRDGRTRNGNGRLRNVALGEENKSRARE
jgi:DNA-binding MarR family transcriptional regulator